MMIISLAMYYIFIQNSLDFSHALLIPLFKISSETSFEKDTSLTKITFDVSLTLSILYL